MDTIFWLSGDQVAANLADEYEHVQSRIDELDSLINAKQAELFRLKDKYYILSWNMPDKCAADKAYAQMEQGVNHVLELDTERHQLYLKAAGLRMRIEALMEDNDGSQD